MEDASVVYNAPCFYVPFYRLISCLFCLYRDDNSVDYECLVVSMHGNIIHGSKLEVNQVSFLSFTPQITYLLNLNDP